jgi:hypothetical protein
MLKISRNTKLTFAAKSYTGIHWNPGEKCKIENLPIWLDKAVKKSNFTYNILFLRLRSSWITRETPTKCSAISFNGAWSRLSRENWISGHTLVSY